MLGPFVFASLTVLVDILVNVYTLVYLLQYLLQNRAQSMKDTADVFSTAKGGDITQVWSLVAIYTTTAIIEQLGVTLVAIKFLPLLSEGEGFQYAVSARSCRFIASGSA